MLLLHSKILKKSKMHALTRRPSVGIPEIEIKGIQTKKELKLSLVTDNVTIYVKDPK